MQKVPSMDNESPRGQKVRDSSFFIGLVGFRVQGLVFRILGFIGFRLPIFRATWTHSIHSNIGALIIRKGLLGGYIILQQK